MTATHQDLGTRVCHVDDIEVEGGVVALVGGQAVAVFRTHAGTVHALGNYDPVGRASVLSRGIVGTRNVDGVDVPFVASPLHKQAYDLRTGRLPRRREGPDVRRDDRRRRRRPRRSRGAPWVRRARVLSCR